MPARFVTIGRLVDARYDGAHGSERVAFAHDALGRVTASTIGMHWATRTLTYRYDPAGNRTHITHPDGIWFYSHRDTLGDFIPTCDVGVVTISCHLFVGQQVEEITYCEDSINLHLANGISIVITRAVGSPELALWSAPGGMEVFT